MGKLYTGTVIPVPGTPAETRTRVNAAAPGRANAAGGWSRSSVRPGANAAGKRLRGRPRIPRRAA